jgi:predicted permease
MTGILSEIKFAFRTLRRSPLFASVAVLSLALGIGANTAIFTLLDQLMLRLLPVKQPEQLVMIWSTGPHMGNNRGSRAASYPMYQDFQQKAPAFPHVFCRFSTPLSISFQNETERVNAELVSGNYFQALGVGPAVGRVFSPEEDDRLYRGHPVAVLSHRYWVDRFGSAPGVIGKKILINNYPMVIVGVSAAGFTGLDPSLSPHIRIPIQMKPLMTPGWDELGNRRSQWIQMFARMKPGFTADSAQASLQPLFHQILNEELALPAMKDTTQFNRDRFLRRTVRVVPAANGYSQMRESYSTALIVLMCMVGLVLLIACFNVANLLIARAAARQKEIAVRLAVGAARRQLIRQLLIESLILSICGALFGIFLAIWTIRGLLSFLPADGITLTLKAEPDLRILGFSLLLAVLTGVIFGLAPALQSTRVDMWNTLKDVAGAVAGGSASVKLRKGLVTAQVALSFLLLAGAGLFVKSLGNLKNTNTGVSALNNLVTFQVDPALNGYTLPQLRTFYKQLLEEIRSTPGVAAAGYNSVPILHGWEWDSSMSVEGHQAKDGEDMQAFMNSISPGYWETLGVRIIEGRDFDHRDEGDRFSVAIVNRKFATHFFGNKSPIGRHVGFGVGPKTKLDIEIIGLVEDSLYEGPREGVRRQVFVPNLQSRFPGSVAFYVRTSLPSASMFSALRQRVLKLDAAMPIFEMKTLEAQLDETLSTERLIATLSAAFGALATLLAAIGLYGVMAFVVQRRTRELGVRMALGARQGAIMWLVMREVLLLLSIGLAIGVPSAYLLSRFVSSQLFGVQPTDGWTAVAAVVVLATVALGAGFMPARRASTIDPIQALRYE